MDMKPRQPTQRLATAPRHLPLSSACISLGPALWFDPNACILLRKEVGVIPLTAREGELLAIFLAHPRCYLSAGFLADRLTHATAPAPFKHTPLSKPSAHYAANWAKMENIPPYSELCNEEATASSSRQKSLVDEQPAQAAQAGAGLPERPRLKLL